MYHFIVLATIRGVECEGLDILKEQLTKLELSKEDLNEIPDNAMIYIEYK